MNILFLSVNDLWDSRYRREGKRNLLDTKLGTADTLAFCGRLESARKTRYGPRLQINDGSPLTVIVGTFNRNVRKDAEVIVGKFRDEQGMYLLIYGNPYKTDQLYVNVNQDNGVIPVDRETHEKFHKLREEAADHLLGKSGVEVREKTGTTTNHKKYIEKPGKSGVEVREKTGEKLEVENPRELTDSEVINFIKNGEGGEGVRLEEILAYFRKFDNVYERIIELMEAGELYEPRPGVFKLP